jgi:hypothetical protein
MPHIVNITLVSGLGAEGRVATDPEWASESDVLQVRCDVDMGASLPCGPSHYGMLPAGVVSVFAAGLGVARMGRGAY